MISSGFCFLNNKQITLKIVCKLKKCVLHIRVSLKLGLQQVSPRGYKPQNCKTALIISTSYKTN